MHKDVKPIVRRLCEQGFTIVKGKKHVKVYNGPKFIGVISYGAHISPHRIRNFISDLKKEGYEP